MIGSKPTERKLLENLNQYLFADDADVEQKMSPAQLDMMERIRAAYTKWLADWHLTDAQMATFIERQFKVTRRTAYNDIRRVKYLLGDVNQAGKEYQRYRANEMILKGYNLAREARNKFDIHRAETMIKAALAMVKVHKLNIVEDEHYDFSDIVPAVFETTGDVSVLGIEPIKNLEEVQRRLREKYGKKEPGAGGSTYNDRVEDVDWEDVDN